MEGFVDIKIERWFTVNDDLSGTFRDIADIMGDSVLENFASGGRPDKWEPLSDGSPRTLYNTGTLRQSLERTYGDDFAEVSTGVPYGRYQQFGARIPVTDKMRKFFWAKFGETGDDKWKWMALSKKTMFRIPPSPFLTFQEEDKEKILEKFRIGIIQFTDAEGNIERSAA